MTENPRAHLQTSLLRFGSATLHEAGGQKGALACAIKPLDPALRLAGPALTVDAKPGDNLVLHHAVTLARPGDVLVVDGKAYAEAALWGDILTLAAQQAGIAGLVVDGAVRDSDSLLEMRFPVFCRALSIRAPQKNQGGQINVPIVCGGVPVHPGDWVMGDRDGVVIIPRSDIHDVLAAAGRREAAETVIRDGIHAGKSTVELLCLASALERVGLKRS